MAASRKPTAPTAEAIDLFCGYFDDLFARLAERTAVRHYLIGLLLPRERNKTLTELAALVPGADRQRLHHFLHDAPWDSAALNAVHPAAGPQLAAPVGAPAGVLAPLGGRAAPAGTGGAA